MSDLSQRNADRLNQATADYNQRQLTPTPPPTFAFYLGYDKGLHKAKGVDGSVYYGQFISTGGVATGVKVSVSLTRGGVPQFDTMPR